jgi:o-succinylbenzoate synthase
MTERKVWFLRLADPATGRTGEGECAPLPGLSVDDPSLIEQRLAELCDALNRGVDPRSFLDGDATDSSNPVGRAAFPALQFALETALLDLDHGGRHLWFDNAFARGEASIRINGLIWMGSEREMLRRIAQKLDAGFSCLKLKIGAIDFATELSLLRGLRREFGASQLELRVDANGAFRPDEALERLKRLAEYELHSIEQPIRAGQWEAMARLCEAAPLPIALDEELIGVSDTARRRELLSTVRPHYVILKPSLVGGFASADEWIRLAQEHGIGWWATSALESNLGLDAIAQWTYQKLHDLANPLPQGLGTGGVFTNNVPSAVYLQGERLCRRRYSLT